ncbi:MAG: helix-turn-helix domain-containing protein [Candidatus Micrarchaeota archaeon]
MSGDRFGSYLREMRLATGMGLREFCKKYGHDPGNISKMERGILPPPQDEEKLKALAGEVGVQPGSKEWDRFSYLASIGNERIPPQVLNNEQLMARLPVIFRSLTTQKITEEQLDKLVEMIQEAGVGDIPGRTKS